MSNSPEGSFVDFGLPSSVLVALKNLQYDNPTPVQSAVIPLAMSGRDVLGASQTGTGKTAAFVIPIISKLLDGSVDAALIMAPTRELAAQIYAFARKLFDRKSNIDSVLLIGGESIVRQFESLERCRRLRLIVGTPGRINDHMRRKKLNIGNVGFLVLDETDRMLDLGFSEQIEAIVKDLPAKRQTMMFSATIPTNIASMSGKYMVDHAVIKVGNASVPAVNIKQEVINVQSNDNKLPELMKELEKREGTIIIFVRTRLDAADLADHLTECGHSACSLHGDLRQTKRDRVIRAFRDKRHRIMVATDVASRGLDIPHIEHVINYDLPQCPEDYVHRIGRTARAGATGSSLIFVTSRERGRWLEISRFIDPNKKSSDSGGREDWPLRRPVSGGAPGRRPMASRFGGFGGGGKTRGYGSSTGENGRSSGSRWDANGGGGARIRRPGQGRTTFDRRKGAAVAEA